MPAGAGEGDRYCVERSFDEYGNRLWSGVAGGSVQLGAFAVQQRVIGTVRVTRTSWQTGRMAGRTVSGDDIDILRPEEIRRLPERQALVIAENGRPIIARLHRSIDGRGGRALLADQQRLRQQLAGRPAQRLVPADLAAIALDEARVRGLTGDRREDDR